MAFQSTFPAFNVTQNHALRARQMAAADEYLANMQQCPITEAYVVRQDARGSLAAAEATVAHHVRVTKSKVGEKRARASVRSANAAIVAAQDALDKPNDESLLQKAINRLNKANIQIDNAWDVPEKRIMQRRRTTSPTKGGTLRRKHRKSVKRCKS
jgi:hypothetical protein